MRKFAKSRAKFRLQDKDDRPLIISPDASVRVSEVSPHAFAIVMSRVVLPETGEGDCSWRWVNGYHSYLDTTFRGGFSIMNLPASKLTSTSRSPVIGSIRQTTGSGLEKATPNKLIFS